MISFNLKKEKLILKKTWKISRESSDFKINFIVEAKEDEFVGLGEAALSARYGQSIESTEKEFFNFSKIQIDFKSLEDLEKLDSMNLSSPLRFAIEAAVISLWAKKEGKSVAAFLGLKEVLSVNTSYSIPIMDPAEVKDYMKENPYASYKLKVSSDSAQKLIREVLKHSKAMIRLDANEGFLNVKEFLSFLSDIDMSRIEFVEQPFPAHLKDHYKELYKIAPCKIMADESFRDERDFSDLEDSFHMVNLKLMKVGSLVKTISLAKKIRSMNKELMIGCMIETSIGISLAMALASLFDCFDLDGSLLVKNDPYDLLNNESGKLTLKN